MSRCVVIGNESLALACSSVLQRAGHEIVAFVTDSPTAADRARLAGLPVVTGLNSLLDTPSLAPDYLFSITNLRVLSPDILALARCAAINYHDGPLPRYGGLNAPVFALLQGERAHGISWHLMNAGVDEGGVLVQEKFELAPEETAFTLNARCYEAALEGFEKLVPMLENGHPPGREAPLEAASYCARGRRPPAGGAIDWTWAAADIARMVRALDHGRYPNPVGCAAVTLGDRIMLIGSAETLSPASQAAPGTITAIDDDSITVATRSSDLRLSRIMDVDGRVIGAAEGRDAVGLHVGTRFGELTPLLRQRLDERYGIIGRHESFWLRRIDGLEQAELPGADRAAPPGTARRHELPDVPAAGTGRLCAAMVGTLGRLAGKELFHVGYANPELVALRDGVEAWLAPVVPLRVAIAEGASFADVESGMATELERLRQHGTWAVDALTRHRGMRPGAPISFEIGLRTDEDAALTGAFLTCCVLPAGRVVLWHDPARFPAAEFRRFADGFHAFLTAAVQDPSTSVLDLPIMPAAERHLLLEQWNATEAAWRDHASLPILFEEQVRRTPDAIAVVDADTSLTYRELNHHASRLAHQLGSYGIGRDSVVGLHVERSVLMAVSVLGIHKAGGAYLPLDPAYPAERLAFMIEDSGARVILSDDAQGLPAGTSATVVSFDIEGDASTHPTTAPVRTDLAGSLAYVIYTSGSTGRPKGVMIEHRNVVNFCAAMDACLGTVPGTWLAVTSLSFDISVLELIWTLTRGYKVVIHGGDAGPQFIPALIVKHGVTDLQCTPSLASMLLLIEGSGAALAQLRRLLVGGEALPETLAEALLGHMTGEVRNMYGPTETTIWSTTHRVARGEGSPPLGRPIANTQLFLLDRWQRPVPIGAPGELYIGGAGVVRGYLHRPALTSERFIASPFGPPGRRLYRTGDLARYRPDGVLEFLGRVDHQVKIRGHRIELGEIEHQLLSLAGAREAVAIARPDGRGDTSLVGYVVPMAGTEVDAAALREGLRAVLPDYMVPSYIVMLGAMPLTPNLKVDRKALPSPAEAPGSRPALQAGDEPRPGAEEVVAQAWRTVLAQERIGRHANFFDLGGHSLMAMQVHHRLRQLFPDQPLTITDIFRYPTIAGLTALLTGEAEPASELPRRAHALRPQPTYFGDAASPLFGMFHRAHSEIAIGKVLLCYPLPPKYMLCYRAFQRLAVSLAEAGFDVLRFDYFGTGDSAGDPMDGSASRWTADCESALQHLSALSPAQRTALVGMRFGATLAAIVTAGRNDVDDLVLWEPIVDGATYVRELEHLASPRAVGGRTATGVPDVPDVLGFPLSAELRNSLLAVSLLSNPPQARRTLLLQAEDRPASDLLAASIPVLERERLGGLEDWPRLIEADSVLLPAPHLRRIIQFLAEG